MTRSILALIVAALLAQFPAPAHAQGYQLVWSDEFDGGSVDLNKWSFDIGTGCPSLCGWGNNELQYYRSQNATVAGGLLTITAKDESWGGMNYTSARLKSINKADFTFGRIEARAKLPIGQGIWPAFWMLFTNQTYGGWAASGEIDIMEYVGQTPNKVFGTIHYGDNWPGNQYKGNDYFLPSGTFHDGFHVFAIEWEPHEIRWYVDGILYSVQNDWYSTGGAYPAPFDHDFHILLNCAVGGNLPGPPDGSTVFPQEYVIDYVRVYQKPEFPGGRIVYAGMDNSNLFGDGWFIFNGNGGGGISSSSSLPPISGGLASLNASWAGGGPFLGGFGRENWHDLTGMTHFSFWIDPDPGQTYTLEINLQDDDNGDNLIPAPNGADDEFQYNLTVRPSGGQVTAGGGWQYVSIPLSSFYDDNSYHWGGNGVFDPYATGNGGNGQLINIVISIINSGGSPVSFRTDRWEFTCELGAISGTVWSDNDGDGVRDAGEAGIAGIPVQIVNASGQPGSTVTDGQGQYSFPSLPGGETVVAVDSTAVPGGSSPSGDPDGIDTPHQAVIPTDHDAGIAGQDFGYAQSQTSVPDPRDQAGFFLRAGVPNPFTASTRLSFRLDRPGPASVTVFDVHGRRVRDLVRSAFGAGTHDVVWEGTDDQGRDVASGFYLVVLATEDGTATRRVLRLR